MTTAAAKTSETTMTLAQFAVWLAAQLTAARLIGVHVWTGRNGTIRIYRGQDYVPVTTSDEWYGGPLGQIVGRDRGFVAALMTACERVTEFSIPGQTVTLSGEVAIPAAPAAAPAPAYTAANLGPRTGCPCGSRINGTQASDCSRCKHDAE